MLPQIINRLISISMKWKLALPFLFFAFVGTTTLTYIGLTSQIRLIKEEEQKSILHYSHRFLEEIDHKKNQALSLATMIAEYPEVQQLLAEQDRQGLNDLLYDTYEQLKVDFEIEQFHFHIPPATSFLRLHYPTRFGEDMIDYRKMILDCVRSHLPISGIEYGETGFGIRGVVPVFHDKEIVGTVEIGHSFGKSFLNDIHRRWDINLALYEIKGPESLRHMAGAGKNVKESHADLYLTGPRIDETPTILIAPDRYPDRSILFNTVKNYSGKPVALVEINMDRSEIQARLSRTRDLMVMVGLAAITISFLLTYLVAFLFIRPIKKIVMVAQDIAQEKRDSRLTSRTNDEIGTLTQALNTMLDALKKRRVEIEEHSRTLERKVQERTHALVSSEENYRTLVENVPLIVYRVLPDGTTEFVNSYLTERLGYTIEDVVSDKRFWLEKISATGSKAYKTIYNSCFIKGEECRIERLLRDKDGRTLSFIEHAIPAKDEDGKTKWIDGIMLDITELKRLQERALRSEEIKILGEISARMAHEIRNPLVTVGGFARRLRDSLPEDDSRHKLAHIIVNEVARLEDFLKILISSIKPFDLSLTEVDINLLLDLWIMKHDMFLKSKGIKVMKEVIPDISKVQADEERINQAFDSLLKHAVISMPEGEQLFISVIQIGDRLTVTFKHKVNRLSKDDLEKFFFPHINDKTERAILDLPLSKIIIHRHRGKIDLISEGDNILVMMIEFPIEPAADSVI